MPFSEEASQVTVSMANDINNQLTGTLSDMTLVALAAFKLGYDEAKQHAWGDGSLNVFLAIELGYRSLKTVEGTTK